MRLTATKIYFPGSAKGTGPKQPVQTMRLHTKAGIVRAVMSGSIAPPAAAVNIVKVVCPAIHSAIGSIVRPAARSVSLLWISRQMN